MQTRETVFVVTTLTVGDAAHHVIADYLRQHWLIENRVHHIRDVTFDEDRHRARTGAAGHVMAILRNTTMSLLRARWPPPHRTGVAAPRPGLQQAGGITAGLLKPDYAEALVVHPLGARCPRRPGIATTTVTTRPKLSGSSCQIFGDQDVFQKVNENLFCGVAHSNVAEHDRHGLR
ncbi:transposase [Nocardia sp. NPDC005366]|uniref:transposase n=1 Tax=Nocardia sp. NPDC005366 TaxID=3156878 RepID=UPI0033B26C19